MYAIATNGDLGEHYLTEQGRWTNHLNQAIIYEYMGEIPPLESELEYIIDVEYDDGGLLKMPR